ncbi:MAG: diaminopimelate decarboxylase [Actinomycetes bacterium]
MVSPIEQSLLPLTAEVSSNGHLVLGGCDVITLAEEYGTPLFIYDEEHLRIRCREAVRAFGPGVAYATKAFLCTAMARVALEEGMCLDVATAGELYSALRAGAQGNQIVLHGNNKSEAEILLALETGVRLIIIDSEDEIDRLERLVSEELQATVLLRVTPGVEAHTHEFIKTGQEDSKFGFSIASGAAQRAVTRLEAMKHVDIAGIHAHIGSQVFDVDSFAQASEILASFFVPLGLRELCVGGGLGVAYLNGEIAPSISEWADAVHGALRSAGVGDEVVVTAEPGRAIVAQAAVTIYRVGTIKVLPDIRTYMAVDGGMSDNPRPVLYGAGYEAFDPANVEVAREQSVRIVGKHCESGDVIVPEGWVPRALSVGDLVATPVTGAYGYSMASTYNKVPRPPVIFVRGGKATVVVRRETVEDLGALDA